MTDTRDGSPPDASADVVELEAARNARRPKKVRHINNPNDQRPNLHLVRGDISRIADEAESALIKANLNLFQRDNLIVSVIEVPAKTADGSRIVVQQIAEAGDHALLEHLDQATRFTRWDARARADVVVDPPMWIVKTMRERKGKLRFRILGGVINAPTLCADGSPLEEPGYDEKTGLLFDPRGVEFSPILWRPTRDQARAALALLQNLVHTFPFVAETDRAVALSAILTMLVRRSLPSTPMHAYTSPEMGTGKSMLVDIASIISTGEEAPVIAAGKTEEELEKRLGALLLAGAPIIAFDNVEGPLGSELLCQTLTQERVQIRILGQSKAPPTSTGCNIATTGINLRLVGDLTRRSLLSRLDARCERPELRVFDRHPVSYAKSNRPALVHAALTILHAYRVAGRPDRPRPLGSFEEWSDLVRGSLMWAGASDPVESMEYVRQSDPERARRATVMAQWRAVIGSDRVTVAEVIKIATECGREDFREGLLVIAGHNGSINSRALGKWLAANKGRVLGGLRFEDAGLRHGVATWQLTRTE
jgi:putative DNA primase/helicase